jgi:hypothetical protein
MNWIVVIDDSCRFPLHVWRYMSRSLGFGIGEVGKGGKSNNVQWISKDKPLETDDGRLMLWWVPADGEYEAGIKRILNNSSPSIKLTFLVDIHGDKGSQYSAIEACQLIQASKRELKPVWHPISAYYSGAKIQGEEVLPKSRDTLEMLRMRLYEEIAREAKYLRLFNPPPLNILVTGAGFEIKEEEGGGFGLPPTKDLLAAMGEPFCKGLKAGFISLEVDQEGGKSFPLPVSGIWEGRRIGDRIREAASVGNLDEYWNFLLENERESRINSAASLDELEKQKVEAFFHETAMREAFRRSILRHDWGYLSQGILAAQMGWHSWLTTNYTHFADRAIDLLSDSVGSNRPRWRTVTVVESQLMLRQDAGESVGKEDRYLFKLHGDLGHLHTMAIAGHDKDTSSPLGITTDLYLVYFAAQNFLSTSLNKAPLGSAVIWHIVGHGLQDSRLLQLLRRASEQSSSNVKHFFVLINKQEALEGIGRRLRGRLPDPGKAHNEILNCPLLARRYMARLSDQGLPQSSHPDDVRAWVGEISR